MREPGVKQLAHLTATLASRQLALKPFETAAMAAGWRPPVHEAIALWRCCGELLDSRKSSTCKSGPSIDLDTLARHAALLWWPGTKPEQLADLAARVWEKSHERVECRKAWKRTYKSLPPVPDYKRQPTLDKVLRDLMPQKRKPDRYRLYRAYLRDNNKCTGDSTGRWYEQDPDTVVARIDFRRPLTERDICILWRNFPNWLAEYERQQRVERAREGGKARAQKRKDAEKIE